MVMGAGLLAGRRQIGLKATEPREKGEGRRGKGVNGDLKTYQNSWMTVVHHVVEEASARGGYPASCEAPVKTSEPIRKVYPYQAVQPGDRCASA